MQAVCTIMDIVHFYGFPCDDFSHYPYHAYSEPSDTAEMLRE